MPICKPKMLATFAEQREMLIQLRDFWTTCLLSQSTFHEDSFIMLFVLTLLEEEESGGGVPGGAISGRAMRTEVFPFVHRIVSSQRVRHPVGTVLTAGLYP
jgi:hypothetical protein